MAALMASSAVSVRRRLRDLIKLIKRQKRQLIFTDFEYEMGWEMPVERPGFSHGTAVIARLARTLNVRKGPLPAAGRVAINRGGNCRAAVQENHSLCRNRGKYTDFGFFRVPTMVSRPLVVETPKLVPNAPTLVSKPPVPTLVSRGV